MDRLSIFYNKEWLECFDVNAEGYFDLVDLIMENDRDTKKESGYELHHIIPRSYYKKKNLKIDNSDLNLIKFTPSEHYMAHYYMCKCAKPLMKRSMVFALHMMTSTATKRKCKFTAEQFARMYEESKLEIAKALKIDCNLKHISAEKRHQGFIKAMKNRSQNEQYCKYLSDRMKGNKLGEGRTKYNLQEINAITGLHNLGFTQAEISRYYPIAHNTIKTQVEIAIKKYGKDKVVPYEEVGQPDRNTVYVYDKLTDNIITKNEAEKKEGMSDYRFLRRLQTEDFRYCVIENYTIADMFDWLYRHYKEDPAIIDRIKAEMERMKEINQADF